MSGTFEHDWNYVCSELPRRRAALDESVELRMPTSLFAVPLNALRNLTGINKIPGVGCSLQSLSGIMVA